jgi:hypothetical protein
MAQDEPRDETIVTLGPWVWRADARAWTASGRAVVMKPSARKGAKSLAVRAGVGGALEDEATGAFGRLAGREGDEAMVAAARKGSR